MNLARASYLLRRVRQAPMGVLLHRALVELRKLNSVYSPLAPAVHRLVLAWQTREAAVVESDADGFRRRFVAACAEPGGPLVKLGAGSLGSGVTCLGFGSTAIPSGHGWHADPFHGASWPSRNSWTIPLVDWHAPGDIKVPWELSRLQFLLPLAAAAVRTPNLERSAAIERLLAIVRDWSANNPYLIGPNWLSAMEVGIRAANLTVACVLVWDRLSSDERRELTRIVCRHRLYLEDFPETSDVNGNHLLFNLLGRLASAWAFEPRAVRERWAQEFLRRAQEQFEPCGIHHERALGYHRYCLEALVLARAFSGPGAAAAAPLDRLRGDAARFLATFDSGSGHIPVIGDADDGSVFALGQSNRDSGYLLADDDRNPGFRCFLRALDPSCSLAAHPVDERVAARSDAWIEAGGHFRSAPDVHPLEVIGRAGALGLAGRAPHDHDDNASFWVYHRGLPIIAERGCSSYSNDLRSRHDTLSARGHNLLLPEGGDRVAPQLGSVLPGISCAPVAVLRIDRSALRLSCSWPAVGAAGMTRHERRFYFEQTSGADELKVDDVGTAAGAVPWHLVWHLAPTVAISRVSRSERVAVIELGGAGEGLTIEIDAGATSMVEIRSEDYMAFMRYGEGQPALRLRIVTEPATEVRLVTLIKAAGR